MLSTQAKNDAIASSDIEAIKIIAKHDPAKFNDEDLRKAVAGNNLDVVKAILKIDVPDAHKVFQDIIRVNNLEMVKLFLDNGASTNVTLTKGDEYEEVDILSLDLTADQKIIDLIKNARSKVASSVIEGVLTVDEEVTTAAPKAIVRAEELPRALKEHVDKGKHKHDGREF